MDSNQGGPITDDPAGAASALAATQEEEAARAAAAARRLAADQLGGSVHRGLLYWMALALVGSTVTILASRPDAALFLAMATLFALAQSWDVRDRARAGDLPAEPALEPAEVGIVLRALVPLVLPVVSAGVYLLLGAFAFQLPPTPAHLAAMRWCWAAAMACLALTIPAMARLVSRAFFARSPYSYTARLSASIALALLLLPVPIRLLIDDIMGAAANTGRPLVDIGSLVAQLVGEVLLAVGAVGLWVARDGRAVRERLGLGPMGVRDALVAVVGLAAVMGVNAGMEWLEHARFPALWEADQAMSRTIAGELSLAASVVLGVSAGVGEEVLVRGALQPRVGLVWASLLFAAGHVQYTWFGMLTIALLGIALGLVRKRANTTTAIVVHVAYDIIAALGAR